MGDSKVRREEMDGVGSHTSMYTNGNLTVNRFSAKNPTTERLVVAAKVGLQF